MLGHLESTLQARCILIEELQPEICGGVVSKSLGKGEQFGQTINGQLKSNFESISRQSI